MTYTHSFKDVTWIDLENPTRDEARALVEAYNIDPLAAEELILLNSRSKVDAYDGLLFLSLNFPGNQEVDFIVGKKFIITARYGPFEPLHKFAKMFEVNSVLEHNTLIGTHAGYMFYYMMREIYHALSDELDSIKDRLDDIEKSTFDGDEQAMVFEISKVSRKLLSFKHATTYHAEALESFESAARSFFGEDFARHIDAIHIEYHRVSRKSQAFAESLAELRHTNNALLETKQNKNIMILTVVLFITSILGIVISLFEIEFKHMPIIGMPNDFWIFTGLVTALGLGLTAFFVHKKWI